jgi:hypothetical protein
MLVLLKKIMRFLLIFSLLTTLTACSFGLSNDTPSSTGSVSGDSVTKVTPTEVKDGTLVSVNYTLHLDSKDGKVFDTSLEDVAKKNGIYKTGAVYQPLQVMV